MCVERMRKVKIILILDGILKHWPCAVELFFSNAVINLWRLHQAVINDRFPISHSTILTVIAL